MAANDKSGFWNDWKAQHPRWHLVLVLELTSIAGLLVVGLIWLRGADIWLFLSENSAIVRDLLLALTALVAFITARAAISQASTARNRHDKQTEADRERRITDSFTKAVELLGKPELEVRLGAIYALERIARESKRDHWPIMETLTAYVRTRAPAQFKAQDATWLSQILFADGVTSAYELAVIEGTADPQQSAPHDFLTKPAADIQAVMTVLTRRVVEHEEKSQRINLSGVNLVGADLDGVNLSGADLSWTDLSRARLEKADLSGASLIKAELSWANLREANFNEAYLFKAVLYEAILEKAFLRQAQLIRADLTRAHLRHAALTGAQLHGVKLCTTTMPDGTINNRDCPGKSPLPDPNEMPLVTDLPSPARREP